MIRGAEVTVNRGKAGGREPGPLGAWLRVMFTPGRFFAGLGAPSAGRALLFVALVALSLVAGQWRPLRDLGREEGPWRVVASASTYLAFFAVATAVWTALVHAIARFCEGSGSWRQSFAIAAYSTAPWAAAGLAGIASLTASAHPSRLLAGHYVLLLAGIGAVRLHGSYRPTVFAMLSAVGLLWTLLVIVIFRRAGLV